MATHQTQVKRSGEGVVGTCACKHRQTTAVATREEAEEWCAWHLRQVARAQADPGKQLTPLQYLAHLQERAADTSLPPAEREQWAMLARQYDAVSWGTPRRPYDTGVETEPLF